MRPGAKPVEAGVCSAGAFPNVVIRYHITPLALLSNRKLIQVKDGPTRKLFTAPIRDAQETTRERFIEHSVSAAGCPGEGRSAPEQDPVKPHGAQPLARRDPLA
jgi:hypothetical protein